MEFHRSFVRKVVYLLAIGLLVYPLLWLSQPATVAANGEKARPGGLLSRIRTLYGLNPTQIGEIDPTSATLKLATLGLRGVATQVLWNKANDYKMKKDWTNLNATVKQITKLQPNFINIWKNQAWNISYNVSVEFDDYRERYRWVIKGFEFLNEGIKYNEREPSLPWEMGRMISQKIGKADEAKQFRRLFAADTDYFESLPLNIREARGLETCYDDKGRIDNWLVGKRWYISAVEMFDVNGRGQLGQSELIFRSSAPMCQMNFAEAMEKDGTFGDKARKAWKEASDNWHEYGDKEIPTSFEQDGSTSPVMIQLNNMEREEADAKKAIEELEALQPGLRASIIAKRKAALTPAQREALDTPPAKRTQKQVEGADKAGEELQVTHSQVALQVSGPGREQAKKLAKEIDRHEKLALYSNRYRSVVNFDYWRLRSQVEQGDDLLNARELVNLGDRRRGENRLNEARDAYEKGIAAWRKVLDKHKEYAEDITVSEDLMETIEQYRKILGLLDEPFPKPFLLQDVIDSQQQRSGTPAAATQTGSGEKKVDEKKSDEKKPGETKAN